MRKNSHNSNSEKIDHRHTDAIAREYSPRMQHLLQNLFVITDHHRMEKAAGAVIEGLLSYIEKNKAKYDFASLDLSPGEIATALQFFDNRKTKKAHQREIGEKFDGRRNKQAEIIAYLQLRPVFSTGFMDCCRIIEDRYPISTVMKALKQVCP